MRSHVSGFCPAAVQAGLGTSRHSRFLKSCAKLVVLIPPSVISKSQINKKRWGYTKIM